MMKVPSACRVLRPGRREPFHIVADHGVPRASNKKSDDLLVAPGRGMACGQLSLLHREHQPQKWRSAYVEEGRAEIDQALAIKNTIPNASAVLFRRATLARHLQSVTTFRYCGDWWAHIRCLDDGRIAYHPEALNAHRQSAGSVTNLGERDTVMLEEALRIKSTLWRSRVFSDRARVLGLIQLLIEAGIRGHRNIESSFCVDVVAQWQNATQSHGRPHVRLDLTPEYLQFADRLICEAAPAGEADRAAL